MSRAEDAPSNASEIPSSSTQTVKIGVLAVRGMEKCSAQWGPTADYLTESIPGYSFTIVPLGLKGMNQAVENEDVDFVVTNTGNYVGLEAEYGASRILTLRNLRQGNPYTEFGAVIFVRRDHTDIISLDDLSGKSFMAVSKKAFGGFQMAWRELALAGIDPFQDLGEIQFVGFPQDNIAFAVRDGEVDAGTVRTDTLERMSAEGKIKLSDFRILAGKRYEEFPFAVSTQLYPEWPFAKARHTSERLAHRVATVLLTMTPTHPACVAANSAGWTIPLDYQPVHDCFKQLRISPYSDYGKFTLTDIFHRYWPWMVSGFLLTVVLAVATIWVGRLNFRLKKAHTDLVSAKDAAEAATRSKSSFLANMSHEIRTPMTAILGFAENMLDENLPNEECREAVMTIRDNGNYLLGIINDILDLSKIEAGKMSIESIPMDPCNVVRDVEMLMSVRAQAQRIEFITEYIGAIPKSVDSDPVRLRQILINLVGNAIKFTKVGSIRLVVSLIHQQTRPQLQFDVIDTGRGMSHEMASQIAQPFTQADASTTREFGGTGLGLTISKRFAGLLGGDMCLVETKLGVGTTMRATIDIGSIKGVEMNETPSLNKNIESPDVQNDQADLRLDGLRILLAEDNKTNQTLIAGILRKRGAEVTVAENGQLAVEAATKASIQGIGFDCILMDMHMPVMNGYDATSTLRNQNYHGAIIALTANAMEGDRQKCIDAGCNDFATKPINRNKLISTIINCTTSAPVA